MFNDYGNNLNAVKFTSMDGEISVKALQVEGKINIPISIRRLAFQNMRLKI